MCIFSAFIKMCHFSYTAFLKMCHPPKKIDYLAIHQLIKIYDSGVNVYSWKMRVYLHNWVHFLGLHCSYCKYCMHDVTKTFNWYYLFKIWQILTLLIFFYIYFFCNFFPIQTFLSIPPLFHDLPPPFSHPYRFLRFFCIPPLMPFWGSCIPPLKRWCKMWVVTNYIFILYI